MTGSRWPYVHFWSPFRSEQLREKFFGKKRIWDTVTHFAHRDRWLHISEIFVNKKSKNFDNFFSWPQTSVFVFFPWCWHDYFHYFLCKFLKSQKNRLINSYRARVEMNYEEHFRVFYYWISWIMRISWKYMYFTTGFPIQMKIFPKIHFDTRAIGID